MAGYKYYHFPSQTGYYTLNSGQYRITLKAYDASFPGDSHEDVNLQMLKLGNLIYEFETDAKDQKSRFGRFDVEFFNKDNFFETQYFLDQLEANKWFVMLEKKHDANDSLLFYGFLDKDNVERSDWIIADSGELVYKKIRFTVFDALYYYQINSVKVTDITAADPQGMLNIAQALNDIIVNINYPKNIRISTAVLATQCGYSFTLADFEIEQSHPLLGYVEDISVQDFIHKIVKVFAIRIYNYAGVYVIEPREITEQDIPVEKKDILNIRKIKNKDVYKRIVVKGKKQWYNYPVDYGDKYDIEHIFMFTGIQYPLEKNILTIDIEKLAERIFWYHGNSDWLNTDYPDGSDLTPSSWVNKTINQSGENFCAEDLAFPGMAIFAFVGSAAKHYVVEDVGSYIDGGTLKICIYSTIKNQEEDFYDGEDYYIDRQFGTPLAGLDLMPMIMVILKRLLNVNKLTYYDKYNEFLLTLFNIEKYQDLSAKYIVSDILDSGSKARKFTFDFNKNTVSLILF